MRTLEERVEELEALVSELIGKRESAPPAEPVKEPEVDLFNIDTSKREPVFGPSEDHLLVEDPNQRKKGRRDMLSAMGQPIEKGYAIVVLCDEPECTYMDHIARMTLGDAKKFNVSRVSKELETLNRGEVRFALECLSTDIGDGHRVSTDDDKYTLPSGRKISLIKAVSWAFSHKPTPPGSVKRTCGRGDCVAYEHLSN